MKKSNLIIGLLIFASGFQLYSQSVDIPKQEPIIYTIGYNKVPNKFNAPLIGFVNVAKGSHTGLQIGFLNTTAANFKGLGIGFANTIGGDNTGASIGFFNTIGATTKGIDIGFFNTIGNSGSGVEVGFFNTLGNSYHGIQTGFFNTLGNSADGIQIGFSNILGNSMNGVQVGFSNILGNKITGIQVGFSNIVGKEVKGLQIGFYNRTRKLSGLEIGFLNVIDTVNSGIPFGFLTAVKKGGYRTLEVGTNEMFPINIAYKTGVKDFYTSLLFSYSPISDSHFGIGMGIGSIIPLNKKLDFNPELLSQITCTILWDQIYSLDLNLNYKLSEKFSIIAGPTVVWNHLKNGNVFHKPVFALYENKLDANNRILIGLKAALSYQF
ncbi:MAG: hypothetical protein WCK78_18265 [Paludibacter sp.]